MPSHLISSSRTGSNIPTDDSDSDTFDDEVPVEDQINATNILVSSSIKTLAGSSRPLTGEQNESSLSNESADDENSLGNENVDNEQVARLLHSKTTQIVFISKKVQTKSAQDLICCLTD